MGTRYYRNWGTVGTGYVPSYSSYTTSTTTGGDRNGGYGYTSYRPYYAQYQSPRTASRQPTVGAGKFDFINGRYSTNHRHYTLRDAEQPVYWRELTDLYLTTTQLSRDYQEIQARYDKGRVRGYGGGLPHGYGPPKYMGVDRPSAAERYGLYDRRRSNCGNRHYDTEITQYEYPSYERKRLEEYQGSKGSVNYNKEMYKGHYDLHDSGPGDREDLDLADGSRRSGVDTHDTSRRHDQNDRYGGPNDTSRGPGDYSRGPGDHSRGPGDHSRGPGDHSRGPGDHSRGPGDYSRGPGDHSRGPGEVTGQTDVDKDSGTGSSEEQDLLPRPLGGGGGGLKKSSSKHDLEAGLSRAGGREPALSALSDGDDFEGLEADGIDLEEEDLFEEVDIEIPEPEPEICVYNEISAQDYQEMQDHLEQEEKAKPLCDYPLIATVTTQVVQVDKIVGEFKKSTGEEDGDQELALSPLPGMSSCYVTSPLPGRSPSDPLSLSPPGLAASPPGLAVSPGAFTMRTSAHETPGTTDTGFQEVKLELEERHTPLGVTAAVVQLSEETIITETEEEVVTEVPAEDSVPDEVVLQLEPEVTEMSSVQEPEQEARVVENGHEAEVEMKPAPVEAPARSQEPEKPKEAPKAAAQPKESAAIEKPKKEPAEKPMSPQKKGRFNFGQKQGSKSPASAQKKKRLW